MLVVTDFCLHMLWTILKWKNTSYTVELRDTLLSYSIKLPVVLL